MYSLQNQNWYGNWYYPTPKPEDTEEEATTKPNYNQNQFVILLFTGWSNKFWIRKSFWIKSILDQNSILDRNFLNQSSILYQNSAFDQYSSQNLLDHLNLYLQSFTASIFTFSGRMSILWLRLQRRILRLLLWITSHAELRKQSLWSNQWLAPKLLWFQQPRMELCALLRQQSLHRWLQKLRSRWRILRYRKMLLFQKNFQKQQCCWQWQFCSFAIKKKVNKEHSFTYLIRIP